MKRKKGGTKGRLRKEEIKERRMRGTKERNKRTTGKRLLKERKKGRKRREVRVGNYE